MSNSRALCATLALSMTLGGCAHWDQLSFRERSAAIGAGVGSVAGAGLSHGHVMGAVAGAAIGGVIGDHVGRIHESASDAADGGGRHR